MGTELLQPFITELVVTMRFSGGGYCKCWPGHSLNQIGRCIYRIRSHGQKRKTHNFDLFKYIDVDSGPGHDFFFSRQFVYWIFVSLWPTTKSFLALLHGFYCIRCVATHPINHKLIRTNLNKSFWAWEESCPTEPCQVSTHAVTAVFRTNLLNLI